MEQVIFKDLGVADYQRVWDYQQRLLQELVQRKLRNRSLQPADSAWEERHHYLLFCAHTPVYTLGKSGSESHLLLNQEGLQKEGVQFYKINRGGDITFHGPGQIVGYPIFDLDGFFTDVHKYVRFLEEAIIRTLTDYGLEGQRVEGYTGVWLAGTDQLPKRKICAIGVHLSRWVTMHGFALNVNTELSYFRHIVPCGIQETDKDVTSMQAELGRTLDKKEVQERLKGHFQDLFGYQYSSQKAPELPELP